MGIISEKRKTILKIDFDNKKITEVREFGADLEKVWQAWTDSNILDQWWAPKPWKAQTKMMDFREGGYWLYCMLGPDGTRQWARADFLSIENKKQFVVNDSFCDENGTPNTDMPGMHWTINFEETAGNTKVEIEINLKSEADLQAILETGFEESFTMAQGNLDELLERI